MAGDLGVGRTRSLTSPQTTSEKSTANQSTKLDTGRKLSLSSGTQPNPLKQSGTTSSPGNTTDPSRPSSKTLVGDHGLQVRSNSPEPTKTVETNEIGTTGVGITDGQNEIVAAGKALHREAAAALDFLLGDLGNFVKKAPHVPMKDGASFEPTNDTHVAAAKDMLKQLIKEHTTLGHKDGVAKAAEQVLKALGHAVDDLKGIGFTPLPHSPKPIATTSPTTSSGIDHDKQKDQIDTDRTELSSTITKLRQQVRNEDQPRIEDEHFIDLSRSEERGPKITSHKDQEPLTKEEELLDFFDSIDDDSHPPPTKSEPSGQRPQLGPGIGKDPTVLPTLPNSPFEDDI